MDANPEIDEKSKKSSEASDGEGKKNKLSDQRASLKFGDDSDRSDDDDDTKGEKKDDCKEVDDGPFDPKKHTKPTAVVYHEDDDFMFGKGVMYKPDDAVPKSGPGVTSEIEKLYGPCSLLVDFKYTTWADTVVPLKNHNVVQGFNEMTLCLMKMAASGGENMSHEDAFLAVSFLSNIRNDLGEYPPNILALMERIDYLTRNDGTPGAGKPKFRRMDGCNLKDWY